MVRRWIDCCVLTLIALVACILLDPVLQMGERWFGGRMRGCHDIVWAVIVAVVTGGLWSVLRRLGGFRLRDVCLWSQLRYPPTWWCCVAGLVVYLLGMPHFRGGADAGGDGMSVVIVGVLVLLGIIGSTAVHYLGMAVIRRPKSQGMRGTTKQIEGLRHMAENPDALIAWLQKEKPIELPKHDLFNMAGIGRRIAKRLLAVPMRSIGLFGEYGSGKTSILNLVDHYLDEENEGDVRRGDAEHFPSERVITCRVGGWGFREGSVAEHVLETAVYAMAARVDCVGVVSVPARYRRIVAAGGSSWATALGEVLSVGRNPKAIVDRMEDVLACARMRLVIYLEDLDRNAHDEKYWAEVYALCDRLKDLEHVSFVLAVGGGAKMSEARIRICDHIETIRELPSWDVTSVIHVFRCNCLDRFREDVDCVARETRDQAFGMSTSREMTERLAMLRGGSPRPAKAIVKLLRRPRMLKAVLQRTWNAWVGLHGEIDFDDLLIANTLRHAAPEGFAFVDENRKLLMSAARKRGHANSERSMYEDPETLWRDQVVSVGWDRDAAFSLISWLFPSVSDSWYGSRDVRPQGVMKEDGVDYWQRMTAEEVDDEEIRDQIVMKAIREWQENESAIVYDGKQLAAALLEHRGFTERVEHFGCMLDGRNVRDLAQELFYLILEGKGERRNGGRAGPHDDYHGFIELWRLSLIKDIPDHLEWVLDQVCKSLPKNLRFANDIYYYWRTEDEHEINTDRVKPDLQRGIVAEAQKVYDGKPDVLIGAIDPGYIYCVCHFVNHHRMVVGASKDDYTPWEWLGRTLLEAAKTDAQVIVPQIAPLVVKVEQLDGGETRYTLLEDVAKQIFGEDLQRLAHLLSSDIDVSGFDEAEQHIVRAAQEEAGTLLN